jgi:hypothetical protein
VDGLIFDPSSLTARQIKEGAHYEGVRVSFLGYLEKARIPTKLFGSIQIHPALTTAWFVFTDAPVDIGAIRSENP